MRTLFETYFKYFLLLALLYMPIFGHLDSLPIRIWDEARVALNAYEMYLNGNYFVTFFDGQPDMWNTKPPLLIWIQVFLMKVIGVNELAVRLPSAFAAFFTCVVLFAFLFRYLRHFWLAFIAVIVLITSLGYITSHVSRTGDYDALLIFFTTTSGLLLFTFLEKKQTKYLYYFFLALTLGVLTKSIAALLFGPALLLYCISQKELLPLLKNKHAYIGFMAFLVVVVSYHLIREAYNPGYLVAIQENDLGGRFTKALGNHKQVFWFYFNHMSETRYSFWYLLIPCGMVIGALHQNEKIRKITLFSTLMVICYFLVVSSAETKLLWYDAPMYPFLAIIVGVFIHYIFEFIKRIEATNGMLKYNLLPFVFLFLLFIKPYQDIIATTYLPKEKGWAVEHSDIGLYIRNGLRGKEVLDNQYIAYTGYNGYTANLNFYINLLREKGVNIAYKDWKNLEENDIVIACQIKIKKYIAENYHVKVLREVGHVKKYKINGRKR